MGLTTAYVIRPDQDGVWRASDRPYLRDVDAEPAGPMLAARVIDSDVCLVLGRSPDHSEWRWVFGEAAATAYAREAGVPGPWLPTLDVEALDDTFDVRAQEAVVEIRRWAAAVEVAVTDDHVLLDVLSDNDAFAETGWWRLLDALGLDGKTDEPEYIGAEADELDAITRMLAHNREPRPKPPTRAIALDHGSSGWRRLCATQRLMSFGEPPCLVEHMGMTYLATDPPLAIAGFNVAHDRFVEYTGAAGPWVEVPRGSATDVMSAVAWARNHVGAAGASPDPDRPAVWAALVPEFLPDRSEIHRYSLAPQVRTSMWLKLAEPVDAVHAAAAATRLREELIERVVTAAAAHGDPVSYGAEVERNAPGFEVVGEQHSARGRFSVTKGDRQSWNRTLTRLRSGELVSAAISIGWSEGSGTRSGHQAIGAGFSLNVRRLEEEDRPSGLYISVDTEFDRVLPRSHLLAVALDVARALPVIGGWIDIGRFRSSTDVGRWGTLRSAGADVDRSAFADVVPVRSTAADLLFATATDEPVELTLAARDAVSQALGEPPLDRRHARLYGA